MNIWGFFEVFKIRSSSDNNLEFAFAKTLAVTYASIPFLLNSGVPGVVFKIFPYVATLILLAFTSKNSAAPKAAGEPFDKAKR